GRIAGEGRRGATRRCAEGARLGGPRAQTGIAALAGHAGGDARNRARGTGVSRACRLPRAPPRGAGQRQEGGREVTSAPRCRAALLMVTPAMALAACGSSPKSSFYPLSPAAAVSQPAAADATPYVVAVGPLTVPDAVDRPQLVVRTGANQLAISE